MFSLDSIRSTTHIGLLVSLLALPAILQADSTNAPQPTSDPVVQETWLGHQVVQTSREIMVIGKIKTQVDAFVLAKVKRTNNRIEIKQEVCALQFSENFGVTVSMSSETVSKLPAAAMVFQKQPSSSKFVAKPWEVVWDERDLEGDKEPGATVHVDAGVCSGEIYVGSSTRSIATGELTQTGFSAHVNVDMEQTIFGASNWCLSVAVTDSIEHQKGFLSYKVVPKETTCQSLGLTKKATHQ